LSDNEVDQKFNELLEVMARLRSATGCPWDKEQTHLSLKPCLLEETYELLDALDDGDPKKLNEVLQQFMAELRKRPELTGLNTFFRPTVPQLLVEVDREKAISLGIPVSDVFDALQSTMGVLYVNDFNKFGRTYRVQMQAESAFRAKPEDVGNVYVRSTTSGEMLPLKSVLTVKPLLIATSWT